MQVVVAVVAAGVPTVVGQALIIAEGIALLFLAAVVVWLCRHVRGLEGGAQQAAAQMRDLIGEAEALSKAIADRLSPEGAASQRSQTPGLPAMPMQAVAARYGTTERAIQTSVSTAENKDEEDLLTVVASITHAQSFAGVEQIVKEASTTLPTLPSRQSGRSSSMQGDGAPVAGSTRIRRSRRQAAAMDERTDGGTLGVEGTLAPVSIGSRTRRGRAGTQTSGTGLFTQTDQEQRDAGAVDREAAREKGMDPVGLALQRRLAGRRARM